MRIVKNHILDDCNVNNEKKMISFPFIERGIKYPHFYSKLHYSAYWFSH